MRSEIFKLFELRKLIKKVLSDFKFLHLENPGRSVIIQSNLLFKTEISCILKEDKGGRFEVELKSLRKVIKIMK